MLTVVRVRSKLPAIASNFMKAHLVEKAATVVTNPQVLINAVSKRVRQLTMGRPPMVLPVLGERYGLSDIALLEIIEGKLKVESDD